MKPKVSALSLLVLVGMGILAGGPSTRSAPLSSEEDGRFLLKAAELSRQGELEANAVSGSTRRAEIHATAQSIADDYARATRQLTDLAKGKEVELLASPPNQRNAVRFQTGSDSDRIAGLIKAHENAVALFHQEAVRGIDPELKRFAETMVPALQRRLVELRALQDRYPPSLSG